MFKLRLGGTTMNHNDNQNKLLKITTISILLFIIGYIIFYRTLIHTNQPIETQLASYGPKNIPFTLTTHTLQGYIINNKPPNNRQDRRGDLCSQIPDTLLLKVASLMKHV